MREVVIASAARLAVGRLGGTLKNSDEFTMGKTVIKAAIERAGIDPGEVDEVVMAQQYRTGRNSGNSARPYAVMAGVPQEVPAYTISKNCGGSIRTVTLAAQAIKAGDAECIVAGGIDIMSHAAHLVPDIRWGTGVRHLELLDQLVLFDPICGLTMGQTAEEVASRFNIGREEQDEYAAMSQQRAEAAIKAGRFRDEIVPLEIKTRKETIIFDTDEYPRFGTTVEKLSKLRPAFKPDGTVTAGNACGMNDGAGAVVVMSAERAEKLGVKPLARIVSYASVGVEPAIMGTGPVPATKMALEKAGLTIDDMDVIELNEAFAAICLYFLRETGADIERLNPNGGAIALGHPISATGSVILTKLLYELQRRQGRYGLATMCIGGGQGIALIVERV